MNKNAKKCAKTAQQRINYKASARWERYKLKCRQIYLRREHKGQRNHTNRHGTEEEGLKNTVRRKQELIIREDSINRVDKRKSYTTNSLISPWPGPVLSYSFTL